MRILVSRPDKIGDVILSLHGVKQLKRLCPSFEIYLHVSKYALPIAEKFNFLTKCITLDEELKPFEIDAVVDLMAKPKMAFNYFRSGIKLRIGNRARWFSFLYNRTAILRRSYAEINEAEYNWRLLSLIDPALKDIPLTDSINIADFNKLPTISTDQKNALILMPGVSISAKPWQESKWLELAQLAIDNDPETFVTILGGPAEKVLLEGFNLQLKNHPRINAKSCQNIDELIATLLNAKSYIGPSTGITHIASALGLPGVALYPTAQSMHPRRWRPFGGKLEILALSPTLSAEAVYTKLRSTLDAYESVASVASPATGGTTTCSPSLGTAGGSAPTRLP